VELKNETTVKILLENVNKMSRGHVPGANVAVHGRREQPTRILAEFQAGQSALVIWHASNNISRIHVDNAHGIIV
jgi:hypothetical protein